jgi:hypothetical protein
MNAYNSMSRHHFSAICSMTLSSPTITIYWQTNWIHWIVSAVVNRRRHRARAAATIHLSIIEMTQTISAIRRICYHRDYRRYLLKCSYGHWHSLQLLLSAHTRVNTFSYFILFFYLKIFSFWLCNIFLFSLSSEKNTKKKNFMTFSFLSPRSFLFMSLPRFRDFFFVTWKLAKRNFVLMRMTRDYWSIDIRLVRWKPRKQAKFSIWKVFAILLPKILLANELENSFGVYVINFLWLWTLKI